MLWLKNGMWLLRKGDVVAKKGDACDCYERCCTVNKKRVVETNVRMCSQRKEDVTWWPNTTVGFCKKFND